jgi:hypothetical protein
VARQPFGGTGADLVYNPGGGPGDSLASVAGLQVKIYTDATALTPANITTVGGTPISNSTLTVDSNSQLPSFLGPDTTGGAEVYILYVRAVTGGAIFKIYRNGGIPGPAGATGAKGDAGAKGDKGDQGLPSIAVWGP